MASSFTNNSHVPTIASHEAFNDIKGLRGIQIGLSIVNIVGSAMILFGNGLVIAAVSKFRSLRTNMFLFICSLAVADTWVGLSIFILTVYNLTYSFDSSDIVMCSIVQIMIVISVYCSLLNMTCIAVDRALAINRPLHYNQYMTPRKVATILFVIWGFSIAAGLCLLAGRTEWKISTCNYKELYLPGYKLFTISYLYAMSILQIILYTQLYMIAHHQQNKILAETQALDQARKMKSDYRAVKMLLLVVSGFLTCWVPLVVVLTVMYADYRLINRTVLMVTYTVACFNSILNPIIYAWKNTKMRQAFKKLLHLPNNFVESEDGSNLATTSTTTGANSIT
jgi:hypothetical protein